MTRIFWFLALTLLVLSSCAGQAPEPTPAPEPEPTLVLSPSPTIDWFPGTPTPTRVAVEGTGLPTGIIEVPVSWLLQVTDDFSEKLHWQESSSSAGTAALSADSLSLALPAGKLPLESISDHILPGSFYLELTMNVLMCSEGDQYGLILWHNSTSGTFRVWFNCQGEVMVDRQIGANTGKLLDWQTARKLQPGAPASNRIAVWAEAGQLRVFANGVEQFTLQTRSDLSGALGVIAQGAGNNASTFSISNLVIYTP
jgi:hypothetical protein